MAISAGIIEASRIDGCLEAGFAALDKIGVIPDDGTADAIRRALDRHADLGPDVFENGVAIVHVQIPELSTHHQLLLRVADPLQTETGDGGAHLHWVWLGLTPDETHPAMSRAAGFCDFMADAPFQQAMAEVDTWEGFQAAFTAAYDEGIHFERHVPEELRPTGKFARVFLWRQRAHLRFWACDISEAVPVERVRPMVPAMAIHLLGCIF